MLPKTSRAKNRMIEHSIKIVHRFTFRNHSMMPEGTKGIWCECTDEDCTWAGNFTEQEMSWDE